MISTPESRVSRLFWLTLDRKAGRPPTEVSCGRGLILADQHAIHRTVTQRHRENDESPGNDRWAGSGDIKVAATCPDDEAQNESNHDSDHCCGVPF